MLRISFLLLITLFLLPELSLGINSAAQEPAKDTLDQRLGPDDGASLAILFGANMRGNLDPCD